MGSKHNIAEYAFAKDVVKDFPKIQRQLDETYKMLYTHRQFLCVQHVLDAIGESREILVRQYKHYKEVLEKKGKE